MADDPVVDLIFKGADEASAQRKQTTVPPASASMEDKRKAQQARASHFGIEALEGKGESLSYPAGYPTNLNDYGDPVNLKYPLAPDARARNARARFKQQAGTYSQDKSKTVVHGRIVEKLIAIGAEPSYDENDALDKLLPAATKAKLERMHEGEREEDRKGKVKKQEPPTGMVVQTLILSKERFKTMAEATKWVKDHGFGTGGGGKTEKGKQPVSKPAPEETGTSFRFRQRPPTDFAEGTLRTIQLTDGVSAVVGKLKPGVKKTEDDVTTEAISKSIDLQGGEELREFINEVQKAVRKLSIEQEDDTGPIMLHGIFTDHLVLRSMGGGFFKTTFQRKPDGSVMLGTLQRVRMSFTPVGSGNGAPEKGKAAKSVEIDADTAELISDLL